MSFWRPFGFHSFSVVDNLLDRETTTLEDLFELEDIIQELKAQNKRLINFLAKPETISKMINYIVANQNETDYKIAIRYPCLSCEVLSSDIWLISDVVYQNEEFLSRLYTFLDGELPSNYSSYASKVAVSLLQKKPRETFEFVTNTGILDKLVKHIHQPPALELLLKLINTESLEGVNDIQQLLTQKELVPKMLSFFDGNNEIESEQQEMISQALIDIIVNSPQSPLVHQLEQRSTVQQLFDLILNEASTTSSFQSGLSVLTELVRRRGAANTGADTEVVEVSVETLQRLLQLLTENSLPSVVMTTGPLASPFGFRKLKILDFLIILFYTNSSRVNSAFSQHDVFSLCLDLFFNYPWNNFVHTAVEQLIQTALERGDNLKVELFVKSRLVERILHANEVNEKESLRPTGRLGYMGHLISIVLSILATSQNNPTIFSILNENTKWQEYIKGPFEERQLLMRRYDPNESHTYENPQEDLNFDEPQQNEQVSDYQNPFPNDFPEDFDVPDDSFLNDEFVFEEKDNLSCHYDFNTDETAILDY